MHKWTELRKQLTKADLSLADQYEKEIEKRLQVCYLPCDRATKENKDIALKEYIKKRPITKNDTRQYFYIQKLGPFSEYQLKAVDRLVEYLEVYFAVEVKIVDDLDENLLIEDAFLEQYDQQTALESEYIIYNLISDFVPRSALAQIVITTYPIFSRIEKIHLMGCALINYRSALWSLAPFDFTHSADESNRKTELEHFLKLSIHEMGHIFSLVHCEKYECAMGVVNDYYLDKYPMGYCPTCLAKLFWNLKIDELDWLQKQQAYWQRYASPENAAFYTRLLHAL